MWTGSSGERAWLLFVAGLAFQRLISLQCECELRLADFTFIFAFERVKYFATAPQTLRPTSTLAALKKTALRPATLSRQDLACRTGVAIPMLGELRPCRRGVHAEKAAVSGHLQCRRASSNQARSRAVAKDQKRA